MQFYSDTVKQMALCQLVVGSPLRTVCLLIAGQPADVFSNGMCTSSLPGAVNGSQHSFQVICKLETIAEQKKKEERLSGQISVIIPCLFWSC